MATSSINGPLNGGTVPTKSWEQVSTGYWRTRQTTEDLDLSEYVERVEQRSAERRAINDQRRSFRRALRLLPHRGARGR